MKTRTQLLNHESLRFFPSWNHADTSQVVGLINMVEYLFGKNPNASHWVEIGSYIGESSTIFLSFSGVKKLECVDQWDEGIGLLGEKFKQDIKKGRCSLHQCHSLDFAAKLSPESIDVAYLDVGSIRDPEKSYSATKSDIDAYWSKIKPNGFLCGHDYSENWPGVFRSVNEFSEEFNLDLKTFKDCSWLVCKNSSDPK